MVSPKKHWENKAEDLKKERKFEEAVEILDKVKEVEHDERSNDFWYKKAVHCCEIGEYEQAKDALFKDLEINENQHKTLFLLGKIFLELHLYEESLEYLNKALEYHDSKILKNINKIELMKNVNKFEQAVIYTDNLNQESDLDDSYWFYKGTVFLKLNKFKDAISSYILALEKNPNNPKILYGLSKAELGMGHKEKTLELLEIVCTMDPANKKKVKSDADFNTISSEKRFQIIVDSLI